MADRLTQRDALARVQALVQAGQGGIVVTPNVDHIVLSQGHPRLREAYRRAALSLADGQPLLWMARLLGRPLPEKISGSDFVTPLMALAAQESWGVFLIGASEDVSQTAAAALVAAHPRLRIVGRDTSIWRGVHSPEVVDAIRTSGARIVVVALGCPKQEMWMLQHAAMVAPAVAFGLGGTLDFLAGAVPRAPRWMSRAGLEWVYRLAQDPRRLMHRYLVRDVQIVPLFAGMFLRDLLTRLRPSRIRPVST
jgi:N-acetylglucosaminyldiphosphoundecaprenol N-acetyl-beta-D-mannosaminyltransferase